jgi:predicted dehydrogenase
MDYRRHDQPGAVDRRSFLRTTAAGLAAGLPAWFIEASEGAACQPPRSANDKPHFALIGCGGEGRAIAKHATRFGIPVAVCDVDSGHAAEASKLLGGVQTYKDFRKLLERKDVDAILTATPDHWHTLINIAALKAGKDVYSEKPLTLTIDEGKHLVATVRSTGRILQTGSQQRSDDRFRLACELVRNGRLGKLTDITTILPAGPVRGPFRSAPVPRDLDWEFWQGQAPRHEYLPERCHLWFRYWFDYSGGTMTDWGAHHNDIALWALGLDRSGPVEIEGKVLVPTIPGGFTAPGNYEVNYVYGNGVRHRCMSTTANNIFGGADRKLRRNERGNGVKFEGSDGWIFVSREKIEASRPELLSQPLSSPQVRLYVSKDHMGNFFDCLRSRKPPICDAEIGHRSVSVCHLGVIALRLGRKLHWDPEREEFAGDKEADKYLVREMHKPWSYEAV